MNNLRKTLALIIIVLAVIILFAIPSKAEVYVAEQPKDIRYEIVNWAFHYGANPRELLTVMRGESGLQPYIKGDNGLACGRAQFHRKTFETFAKEAGLELEYCNPQDEIQLMAWAFSQGEEYKNHWTVYRNLY